MVLDATTMRLVEVVRGNVMLLQCNLKILTVLDATAMQRCYVMVVDDAAMQLEATAMQL